MSDSESKEKHSRRIHQKHVKAHHNAEVARSLGADIKPWEEHRYEDSAHVNCGNSDCVMCANPRKVFKEKTIQEKSLEQNKLWDE